jgi:hypothetical protein
MINPCLLFQIHCPVCHEVFDQFWDTEQEEWMYRASVINPTNNKITHQKCLSNLGNGNQSVWIVASLVMLLTFI